MCVLRLHVLTEVAHLPFQTRHVYLVALRTPFVAAPSLSFFPAAGLRVATLESRGIFPFIALGCPPSSTFSLAVAFHGVCTPLSAACAHASFSVFFSLAWCATASRYAACDRSRPRSSPSFVRDILLQSLYVVWDQLFLPSYFTCVRRTTLES